MKKDFVAEQFCKLFWTACKIVPHARPLSTFFVHTQIILPLFPILLDILYFFRYPLQFIRVTKFQQRQK
ncbi:MAG: hypothetical protein DRI57_31305 [Deltaproteobacteria bacterium]|nr:MAG: hypothetical protein DRI57_31305 [Deltaproteobacteria bacterium]